MKPSNECDADALATYLAEGRIVVFLDANVLIPQYLRSVFLDLAQAKLFLPCWTRKIFEEVRRNLLSPRGRYRLKSQAVEKLFNQIEATFPTSLVQVDDRLDLQFDGKTDPKDRHVAAGALQASLAAVPPSAVVLVTHNVRDLPQTAFDRKHVLVASPDRFLGHLLARFPEIVSDVLIGLCARLRSPPITRPVLLRILVGSGCGRTAAALATLWRVE